MSILSGLLPVEQGIACLAALQSEATRCKATGDDRSRSQIMADTLVERVTGQARAEQIAAEVRIVMPRGRASLAQRRLRFATERAAPLRLRQRQSSSAASDGARRSLWARSVREPGQLEALIDPDDPTPSDVGDFGPVPAPIIDDLLAQANSQASWWRRIFTKPGPDGKRVVVDIDPKRHRFIGKIADLINARDRHCRDPFCTAPIRHHDHIIRHTDGGLSTADNGRGVCERGNYVREMPGWSVKLVDADTHTIIITTPTGHTYVSRPPEPP